VPMTRGGPGGPTRGDDQGWGEGLERSPGFTAMPPNGTSGCRVEALARFGAVVCGSAEECVEQYRGWSGDRLVAYDEDMRVLVRRRGQAGSAPAVHEGWTAWDGRAASAAFRRSSPRP